MKYRFTTVGGEEGRELWPGRGSVAAGWAAGEGEEAEGGSDGVGGPGN